MNISIYTQKSFILSLLVIFMGATECNAMDGKEEIRTYSKKKRVNEDVKLGGKLPGSSSEPIQVVDEEEPEITTDSKKHGRKDIKQGAKRPERSSEPIQVMHEEDEESKKRAKEDVKQDGERTGKSPAPIQSPINVPSDTSPFRKPLPIKKTPLTKVPVPPPPTQEEERLAAQKLDAEKLQSLLGTIEDSKILKQTVPLMIGIKLKELLKKAREGDLEALGTIGVLSYLIKESDSLRDTTDSLGDKSMSDLAKFIDVSDTARECLSRAKGTGPSTINELLALYYMEDKQTLRNGMRLLIRSFKAQPVLGKYPIKNPDWAFRLRLALVVTGHERYLEGDEESNKGTRALIEKYAQKGHAGAQCIRAHACLTGRGFKKDSETALADLNSLATTGNNALAQWILGLALYQGEEVEQNITLGLELIFKAAKGNCFKAFQWMNSTFPLPPAENEGPLVFRNSVKDLYDEVQAIIRRRDVFSENDWSKKLSVFEKGISNVLLDLSRLIYGFKVNGFKIAPKLRESIQSLKNPSFIYCTEESELTWGEDNVKAALGLKAFFEKKDTLLQMYDEGLDEAIKEIKDTITKRTQKVKKAETQPITKDPRLNKKIAAQLQETKEVLTAFEDELVVLGKDRGILISIIERLKELIAITSEERTREFIKAYPFFRPL